MSLLCIGFKKPKVDPLLKEISKKEYIKSGTVKKIYMNPKDLMVEEIIPGKDTVLFRFGVDRIRKIHEKKFDIMRGYYPYDLVNRIEIDGRMTGKTYDFCANGNPGMAEKALQAFLKPALEARKNGFVIII